GAGSRGRCIRRAAWFLDCSAGPLHLPSRRLPATMSAMSTRLIVPVLIAAAFAVVLAACGSAPEPEEAVADWLPPRPWNIAHRGAAAYAPENTLPAYALGADQGAHFVEIDLQRTKDGQLISLHD